MSKKGHALKRFKPDNYFLIDASGSMEGRRMHDARTGVTKAVLAADPDERMAIISFDTTAHFRLKPRPIGQILRQNELPTLLNNIRCFGMTAIYDAIYMAVSNIWDKDKRTRIVVLTDGEDNSSGHSLDQVLELIAGYPNISLDIIHVDGKNARKNETYELLCRRSNGEYILIKEEEIVDWFEKWIAFRLG